VVTFSWRKRRSFRLARTLFLVAALGVTILVFLQLAPQRSAAVKPGVAAAPAPAPAPSSAAPVPDGHTAGLDAAIQGVLADNNQYQVGVAVRDPDSGALRTYGVDAPFEAASTAKVLTAVSYYKLVEAGQASLDDPMGEYTAGFQIREMIQDSDNDSWSLLVNAVGLSALEGDAAAMGVAYDSAENTLTPAGMAQILADLYGGKLLNQEHTQQLLSYMQNTNDEDLIPAAVPAGVAVFHKYGLLDGELHDAAILSTPARSVVLVIYTKGGDITDVPERTAIIHEITAAVAKTLT
jgi:beta-lactamase class A